MNERGQEFPGIRETDSFQKYKQAEREDSSLLKHVNMTCFRLVFLLYYASFQETMHTV
jgi:hypothetical protein